VINGNKVGGNVASYFTLPDGRVLHIVGGPVDADTLLHEARWVIETRKLAILEAKGDANKYKAVFRKAHAERLQSDHGVNVAGLPQFSPTGFFPFMQLGHQAVSRKTVNKGLFQDRIHWLLYSHPLADIKQIYPIVFEKVLFQPVSGKPVAEIDLQPKPAPNPARK
jgi:hypothetical protein